jgi:KDO2-lipid IV(A) lauroyltransferase
MKKISHFIEYCVLRLTEALISALPRKLALLLGAAVGVALYHLGIYLKIVNRNFDHVALFDKTEQQRIIKRLYANIGRYGVDMLCSEKKPPAHTVDGLEYALSLFERKKGIIAVLAHFGNWELMATFFGSRFDLSVLARPMHNPLVEKWLLAKRKRSKVSQIYAAGALRKIIVALKRNGMVAMLIDQYSAENGTPAPFLGKQANTVRTAAGILCKTDCGIVLPYALLQRDGTYRVVVEAAPTVDADPANETAFIDAHVKAHNDTLSRWITQYPDHYFGWFHKRFKDVIEY